MFVKVGRGGGRGRDELTQQVILDRAVLREQKGWGEEGGVN